MITFYGYAVKKNGKWLGYKPNSKGGLFDRYAFYKRPKFPVVCAGEERLRQEYGHIGEIVKVELTMEKEGADK